MKNKQRYSRISLFAFIAVAVFISIVLYWKLFFTFYQQDEWSAVGSFFAYGPIGPLHEQSWMTMLAGAGRPLIWPLHLLIYWLLPFRVWPLAVFSLVMQPVIGVLTYAVVFALTGNTLSAWAAGLFFLVSYNGSQSVSWFATSTITLASTFCGLLAVLWTMTYMRLKKGIYLALAQISVICSYFFKEAGVMFVLFLPFLYVVISREKQRLLKAIRIFWPIMTYFSLAIILTLIRLLTPTHQVDKFVGQSSGGIMRIIEHVFFYPILSFSQLFIPFPFVKKVSPALAEVSPKTDAVFIGLSVLLLSFLCFSIWALKRYRKQLTVSVVFILFSFVPYAVLERGASYLSSRYFYVGLVGGSMLVGIYAAAIWEKLMGSGRILRFTIYGMCIIVAGLYAYKNMQFIGRDIQLQVLDARERLAILREIKREYPALPDNPVLYVTGDHPGYYYVANQKMPFQQGIGFTFLVWYYPDGGFTLSLLRAATAQFWDISAQGYREVGGRGFGYYWDKSILVADLEKGLFSKNQVIGLYYHSGDQKLENITEKLHGELP